MRYKREIQVSGKLASGETFDRKCTDTVSTEYPAAAVHNYLDALLQSLRPLGPAFHSISVSTIKLD